MEAENKLYADMHGYGQGQSASDPPLYTPTPPQQQDQAQGYPPYGQSTVAGLPYYAPPSGAGYGGGYGVSPTLHQQQVTVLAADSPNVYVHPVETFDVAMAYSCFVCFCCNWVFGLIGIMLAMMARDKALVDAQGARQLGRASYIVSTVGIVVTIIIFAVYFGVFFNSSESCRYTRDGVCYD